METNNKDKKIDDAELDKISKFVSTLERDKSRKGIVIQYVLKVVALIIAGFIAYGIFKYGKYFAENPCEICKSFYNMTCIKLT